MRKRKQEKQIDQQIDNQSNHYQILKQKICACQAKVLELEEQIEMKEKRNKFIDDEIKLKLRDLNNVEKIFEINKELEINEIKSHNNEQKSNSSTTIFHLQQQQKAQIQQQFLYKQKISQEYFSNFMEKYFQYFDSCIGQELIQEKEIENDNEKIYISPMVKFHTIQIQCFIKLLDPKLRTQVNQRTADNQDYVTITFRYSKSDTFDNLKLVCLQYWNIIELDNLYAPDTFNQDQNQYQIKMRKYEFLAPDFTKIPNTELIERYCENFEQRFEKEKYVNAILKKKVIKLQGYQDRGDTNTQINESQAASQFLSRTFNNQTLMNYTIQAEDSQLAHQQLQNSISGDLSLDDANFAISNMISSA